MCSNFRLPQLFLRAFFLEREKRRLAFLNYSQGLKLRSIDIFSSQLFEQLLSTRSAIDGFPEKLKIYHKSRDNRFHLTLQHNKVSMRPAVINCCVTIARTKT